MASFRHSLRSIAFTIAISSSDKFRVFRIVPPPFQP
jgi:hypothetical protein